MLLLCCVCKGDADLLVQRDGMYYPLYAYCARDVPRDVESVRVQVIG